MYAEQKCVACHSTNITTAPAKLARFVAWKALDVPVDADIEVQGMQCLDCSFVGSVDRFLPQEEHNLYNDYRGTEYTRIRTICEPEYPKITEFIEHDYCDNRKIGISALIKKHVDVTKITNMLDYGGDTGSMIPDTLVDSNKYVYDISEVPTIPGVKKYNQYKSDQPFNFIMCCHVLEHKPDPDDLLEDIKRFGNANTWFYFEVPNNPNPFIGTFHEHINFFNLTSLTALLERNGFRIEDHFEYGFSSAIPCHKNNLCVLAKL